MSIWWIKIKEQGKGWHYMADDIDVPEDGNSRDMVMLTIPCEKTMAEGSGLDDGEYNDNESFDSIGNKKENKNSELASSGTERRPSQ
jgi:hypothetical protein